MCTHTHILFASILWPEHTSPSFSSVQPENFIQSSKSLPASIPVWTQALSLPLWLGPASFHAPLACILSYSNSLSVCLSSQLPCDLPEDKDSISLPNNQHKVNTFVSRCNKILNRHNASDLKQIFLKAFALGKCRTISLVYFFRIGR